MTPASRSGVVTFGMAAPNPVVDAKEASAFGGAEGGRCTSAPTPGKATLVVAASNPLVGAKEASAFGGAEGGLAPRRRNQTKPPSWWLRRTQSSAQGGVGVWRRRGRACTSAPTPGKAALVVAASNPTRSMRKEASASGGAEGGRLHLGAETRQSRPRGGCVEPTRRCQGGVGVWRRRGRDCTSAPNRTDGASGASTERRPATNLHGGYAASKHTNHLGKVSMWPYRTVRHVRSSFGLGSV